MGVKSADSQGPGLGSTAGGPMGMFSSPCPALEPGLGSVGSKGLSGEPRGSQSLYSSLLAVNPLKMKHPLV